MATFANPANLLALGALLLLEIVLGIDNVVLISILTGKLAIEERKRARIVGLVLALVMRILLLLTMRWLMRLTTPLFTVFGVGLSAPALVLIGGGVFLIVKSGTEIRGAMDQEEQQREPHARPSFASVLFQILILDVVFSLDSVIVAVGMVDELAIIIAAMVLAMFFMLAFSGFVSRVVDRHPTVKMLALAFLVLIGLVLVGDGAGRHIPDGYIYSAMAFALFVEILNFRARAKRAPTGASR